MSSASETAPRKQDQVPSSSGSEGKNRPSETVPSVADKAEEKRMTLDNWLSRYGNYTSRHTWIIISVFPSVLISAIFLTFIQVTMNMSRYKQDLSIRFPGNFSCSCRDRNIVPSLSVSTRFLIEMAPGADKWGKPMAMGALLVVPICFIVEQFGRRKITVCSLALQMLSLLIFFFAHYLQLNHAAIINLCIVAAVASGNVVLFTGVVTIVESLPRVSRPLGIIIGFMARNLTLGFLFIAMLFDSNPIWLVLITIILIAITILYALIMLRDSDCYLISRGHVMRLQRIVNELEKPSSQGNGKEAVDDMAVQKIVDDLVYREEEDHESVLDWFRMAIRHRTALYACAALLSTASSSFTGNMLTKLALRLPFEKFLAESLTHMQQLIGLMMFLASSRLHRPMALVVLQCLAGLLVCVCLLWPVGRVEACSGHPVVSDMPILYTVLATLGGATDYAAFLTTFLFAMELTPTILRTGITALNLAALFGLRLLEEGLDMSEQTVLIVSFTLTSMSIVVGLLCMQAPCRLTVLMSDLIPARAANEMEDKEKEDNEDKD